MADARRSIGRPASANGAASLARDTAPSRLGSKGPRSSPWQLKRASVSDPEIAEIDRPAMPARSASTLAKATSQSQSLALPQIPIIDAAIAGVPPPKLARSNSARSVARSNSARSSRAPAARQPSPETSLPVLPSLSFEQSISIPSLQELEADPHRQRINEVIANALRRTHESFAHLSDNPEDSAFTLPTLS
ncbi:hypothetical protein HK105_200157 [Polyrhizophydium stewartii]|uniref:Uncharacterized protein n=1 Tax=Polyrhizophydium stewartii TaxID=2732419 RepID=A0ABR4NKP2_9FUNG